MKKSFGIVAVLVFVLSFGTLAFAQNSNSNMSSGNMSSTGKTKSRKHRKARRHRSSKKKSGGSAKSKNGNSNM